MTTRELRTALLEIRNQNITLEELRKILFVIEDQDKELTASDLASLTLTKAEQFARDTLKNLNSLEA